MVKLQCFILVCFKHNILFLLLLTIRCDPEGAPQPKFIWRKDGNRIALGGKYIIDRNGTRLFINRINIEGKTILRGIYDPKW